MTDGNPAPATNRALVGVIVMTVMVVVFAATVALFLYLYSQPPSTT